jgi:hypothetical protein
MRIRSPLSAASTALWIDWWPQRSSRARFSSRIAASGSASMRPRESGWQTTRLGPVVR